MKRLCTCGHRKYKHNQYPLDRPFCKGAGEDRIYNKEKWVKWCMCIKYEPIGNLEWLELQVDKNV
jgi:hypothetical protein